MFAALSTIEPPIVERSLATLFEQDRPWFAERQAMLDARVRTRLSDLSRRLDDADWLDDAFSAGDLLTIAVLRRLKSSGLLEEYPNIAAYVARGEARPAFRRAFAAQLEVFERNAAAG
jgi:glutathione S-transferase